MKKYCKFLFFISLANCISYGVSAQSALSTFSPSSSTLIGNASRIGYHYNNRTSYYMRYNDASYICCALSDALVISSPSSVKIPMPQDFIISDFKKFRAVQGFIGSYQGVGMFGHINEIDILSPSLFIQAFKLPAVDRLSRIAICLPPTKTKAFAIGEKEIPSAGINQSYLLEFYAEGAGSNAPYKYIPLVCIPESETQEIADDVITLGENIVFATRYIATKQKTIILRVSDTSAALSSIDIKIRRELLLQSYEILSSKLRMIPLDNVNFILTFIIFDERSNAYRLRVLKINLPDFLSGVNSIVSHEIRISKGCSELADMIYEPDVQTMVILLNGEGSEFYYVNPYSVTNDNIYELEYPDHNFYSIDSIGNYTGLNRNGFYAMGRNEIFWQIFSNIFVFGGSCLPKTQPAFILCDSPQLNSSLNRLSLYVDNRVYVPFNKTSDLFYGLRTCSIFIPE